MSFELSASASNLACRLSVSNQLLDVCGHVLPLSSEWSVGLYQLVHVCGHILPRSAPVCTTYAMTKWRTKNHLAAAVLPTRNRCGVEPSQLLSAPAAGRSSCARGHTTNVHLVYSVYTPGIQHIYTQHQQGSHVCVVLLRTITRWTKRGPPRMVIIPIIPGGDKMYRYGNLNKP